MSSIKKAVKKVFRGVKKVVKKYAKPALIIAGTLFTAGVAAGGFGAFSTGMGALGKGATIAEKIGTFMKAVGTTIGAGAQAITGSLGLSQGISGSTAQAMGNPALQGAGLFGGGGMTVSGVAGQEGMGALQTSLNVLPGAGGTVQSGRSGFLGNVMNALGSFTKTDTGKLIVAQGIMSGIQSYAAARQADKERKRFNKEAVFGVRRQGSGGESLLSAKFPELSGGQRSAPSSDQYRPGAQGYETPVSGQGLLARNTIATPAPTQNPSPAWGGPQPMPMIQGNYQFDYSQQSGNQLIDPNQQYITPIGPVYG